MTWLSGPSLPFVALAWPLLLGLLASLPVLRPHAMRLLPLAPLPALWLALSGTEGMTQVPDLLLGVNLQAERPATLLLGLTATLWLAAAIHAQGYMAGTRKPAVFSGFWCLTLAGNLGVFIAQDLITFYVAFAAVSLSAYFLIVHDGTQDALSAGRVYAVLAICGEVCLLIACVIGAAAAGGLMIADVRDALPAAPLGGLAAALLIASFGIKIGLMPLHVWLPLAHPVAPTPASAVLSGAIVKAGIIGLMLLLPAISEANLFLVLLGFFTAFAGALAGLRANTPKAILAYSTISQLGLIAALIGSAAQMAEADMAADMAVVAYYAFHHGLAKGALFLSVAVVAASSGRWRTASLLVAGLTALSIAGAPFTGGGLAKAAAKGVLGDWAKLALTVSAVTTTLVLSWFLYRLWDSANEQDDSASARPSLLIALPTWLLALVALVLPWWLLEGWGGMSAHYVLELAAIWSALWPVALGCLLAALAMATPWPGRDVPSVDPLRGVQRGLAVISPWRTIPDHLARWRSLSARQVALAIRHRGRTLALSAQAIERVLIRSGASVLVAFTLVLVVAVIAGG